MYEVKTTPFTAIAVGVCLVFSILAFLAYWYIGTEKHKLGYNFRRVLTLYNMFLACFHFVIVVMASEVVGANGSVVGFEATITSRGQLVLWAFVASRIVLLTDFCVVLYRSDLSQINFWRIFSTTCPFILWGLVLDNRKVHERATVLVLVLVNAFIALGLYTHLALVPWLSSVRKAFSCFGVLLHVLGHSVLVVYCGVAIVTVRDVMTFVIIYTMWIAYNLLMLWNKMAHIWRYREPNTVSPPDT